ncbi:MAG: RluA family pseudouridine synthase [Treponema sp.]|nr:RluA family pseudouridine synthase [Treponema sp.]
MKNYSFKTSSKIRLDLILREKLPLFVGKEISNSKIRRLIVAGSVFVNGRQIRVPSYEIFSGGEVSVNLDEEKLFFEKTPDDIKFELSQKDILFEDDFIICVNKPAHFPVESTVVEGRDNLHDAVVRFLFERQKIEKPNAKNPPYVGIMHRLDAGTSGVILFSKSRTVNKPLHEMFENRTEKKNYIAVACGVPKQEKFSVEFFMGRISPKSQAAKWGKLSESKGGLWSKTDFELISSIKNEMSPLCVLKCSLHTGRTHQIRVHLASVGCPILGDELYGGKSFSRIMLHAKSLEFPHPVSQKIIRVEAPLPDIFNL